MPPASGRDSRGGGVHELPHAAGPLDVDPLKDAKGESQSPTSSHTACYVVFSRGKYYFGRYVGGNNIWWGNGNGMVSSEEPRAPCARPTLRGCGGDARVKGI